MALQGYAERLFTRDLLERIPKGEHIALNLSTLGDKGYNVTIGIVHGRPNANETLLRGGYLPVSMVRQVQFNGEKSGEGGIIEAEINSLEKACARLEIGNIHADNFYIIVNGKVRRAPESPLAI